jgi:hypothetical protein
MSPQGEVTIRSSLSAYVPRFVNQRHWQNQHAHEPSKNVTCHNPKHSKKEITNQRPQDKPSATKKVHNHALSDIKARYGLLLTTARG